MRISNIIYGREKPLSIMQEAFQWASLGSTELVLLSGLPGVGKSSFVLEAFRPTIVDKCHFAWGKFNSYNKSKPYEPLIHCFQFLIRRLLMEPEDVLRQWQEKLKESVGVNGSVIIDVIPEAGLLLGDLPPSEQLPPSESHHRFEWVFRRFVQAFTRTHYPLVLFLDDLQWADRASLQLLQSLIIDPDNQNLLIIGASRDQEWNENGKPFKEWHDPIHLGYVTRQIHLEPLDIVQVQIFLSHSLGCDHERCFPLAHLLYVKSIGNPLYLKQLLQSACDEEMIRYSHSSGKWEWDIARLNYFPGIEGQVEYLIDRINKLKPISKQLLLNAACLGTKFSSRVLHVICHITQSELDYHLSSAVQAGLLAYTEESGGCKQYNFVHDRVHQAAYSILNNHEREDIHLSAGRFLLEAHDIDSKVQALFEITDHMNEALGLLTAEEREQVARLNEQAGRKAMLSAAYETALRYYSKAIECLPVDYWSKHYEFTYQLHLQCSECDYLCGNYAQAENRLNDVWLRTQSWVQRAQVVKLKIDQYCNTGKYAQAIELGLTTLREVGIRISARPNKLVVMKEMLHTKWLLDKRMNELSAMPIIDDHEAKLMMEIMISLVGPTFFSNREVFAVIASKFIRLVFRYGANSVAPVIYASYGMLLSSALGDLSGGYRLGEISVELSNRSNIAAVKSKVYVMFYSVISPWMRNDRLDEEKLMEAAKLGMEAGDYVYASYAIGGLINLSYTRHSMNEMHRVMRQSLQIIEHTKEELVYKNILVYLQMSKKLQSDQIDVFSITDGRENEEEFINEVMNDESGAVTLYQIYTYKTQICYLFGRYEESLHYAELANAYEVMSVHAPHLPIHHLYEALSIAAILRKLSQDTDALRRRRLKQRYRQFKNWSGKSSLNFNHMTLLIRAEITQQQGPEQEVIALYDQSIKLSREARNDQVLAVACECAARFHMLKGRERVALSYMEDAYEAYGSWGVESKRSSLRLEFPSRFDLLKKAREPAMATSMDLKQELHDHTEQNDLIKMVKDSLTLTQDMDMQSIKRRLITLIMQTSGADKGCLIALKHSKLWVEEMLNENQHFTGPSEILEESEIVPKSLVQYTARLGKSIQLDNAAEDELFRYDPYIQRYLCRSISCLPIYAQEHFAGVLYLEIPQVSHPLSETSVDTLCMLAAQALFIEKLADALSSPTTLEQKNVRSEQREIDSLTDRELEVLNLMSTGLTNKEIAFQLGVTAGTIKVHIHNIFSKLNVNKRTKAIAEAVKLNLL
jgi:predicted ATPase/DNA-binding CsgD family transcriptional regulator